MMDASNEAESKSIAQPRLSFSDGQPAATKRYNRIWVLAVTFVVLVIAILTIKTAPETPKAPPPLQTFVRPKGTARPSLPASVRPQTRKTPEPFIRVNLTPGGADSFQLEVRGPCRVTSLDQDEKIPADLLSHRLVVSSTTRGLKLGTRQFASSRIEIQASQPPGIKINGHLYRGRVKLYRRSDGQVSAVNELPIEDYLASVVDSEMPAKFPDAARQAQAIVARTYALYQIQQADPNAVYDVFSSQRSQKYLGVEYVDSAGRRLAGESDSSRRAVKETRGIVCTWHKALFSTYYSAVCGGRTTHGREIFKDSVDALKSVPCEWCRESPHYRWKTELARKNFEERAFGPTSNSKKTTPIRAVHQTTEPGLGAISRFEFDTGNQRPSVSGVELRDRLPSGTLFSPHFRIKLETDRVVFEGRGHGHGVGFCQWGAKGQAEAGRSSIEIVRHYYPGAELTDLGY